MPTTIDWKKELDKLLSELCPSWPPDDAAVKKRVRKVVAKWIAGDRDELADAIAQALADDKVTRGEIIGILVRLAQSFPESGVLGSEFVKNLLARLEDGALTSEEIADVVVVWAAGRTSNENLKRLIKAAADGRLSRDEIEAALLARLRDRGENELADLLADVLDGPGPLTLDTVVPLVVGYLVQRHVIRDAGGTTEKQISAVVSGIERLDGTDLVQVLRALIEERYVDAVRLVVVAMGIAHDEAFINAVVTGDLEQIANKYLSRVLSRSIEGITASQAQALAATIIGVLKGEVELIPRQTEQEQLGMPDDQYCIWLRTRKVLYAAKLAVSGGSLIPTEAMARPHIFAAAAIAYETPVNCLCVGDEQCSLLCQYILRFARAEFREFGECITLPPMTPDELAEGQAAKEVHKSIWLARQMCGSTAGTQPLNQ